MLVKTKDVHKQFAYYFDDKNLTPYLYWLSKKLSEGSICLDLNTVNAAASVEEDFDAPLPASVLKKDPLVSDGSTYAPFILSGNYLYLQRYYHYETLVLKSVINRIAVETQDLKSDLPNHKEWIRKHLHPNNSGGTDWQSVAAISSVLNRFTIITGGPGTGKTTTVAKILSLLFLLQPDLNVALAAPTGKAAARMAESLKESLKKNAMAGIDPQMLVPSTIHRLLKVKRNSIYFKHDHNNPLSYDLVVVDESSMIDVALFAKLMDALKPEARVIFLGDRNQLSSVEAGSLFGDLCQAQERVNVFSKERALLMTDLCSEGDLMVGEANTGESDHPLFEHVIELKLSYRFSDDEGIGRLSKAIIENRSEAIESFFKNEDPRVLIDLNKSKKVFDDFVRGYENYIREADLKSAFKKLNQLRILCAVRQGPDGMLNVNRQVEGWLSSKKLLALDRLFYVNRPVMVTSNNPELGLFNGDIGIVRRDPKGALKVFFEMSDGEIKGFLPAYLDSCETVFAMTIHKSQGSEFDHVLTILPSQPDLPLLSRELLYTAVTRAKENITIWADKETILATVERKVQRGSGIARRFLTEETSSN